MVNHNRLAILLFACLHTLCLAAAQPPPSSGDKNIPIGATTQTVNVSVQGGTLHGTVDIPQSPVAVPLVMFIAGPITIDRNGNTHLYPDSNNTMKYLSEALVRQGVATLRFDKRGVGQSSSAVRDESELRVEHYVDDAVAWTKKMQEDKRFSSIILLGYDESFLVAALAAKKIPADGIISVAGFGRPMQDIMLERAKIRFPSELLKRTQSIVSALEQGKMVDTIPQLLYMILRPSIQPYLISQFKFHPAREFAKLQIPGLVIHGTKDFHFAPSEAAMLSQSNTLSKLVLIEGMTHSLRELSQEQLKPQAPKSRFASIINPLMPRLIGEIAEFCKTVAQKKKK